MEIFLTYYVYAYVQDALREGSEREYWKNLPDRFFMGDDIRMGDDGNIYRVPERRVD